MESFSSLAFRLAITSPKSAVLSVRPAQLRANVMAIIVYVNNNKIIATVNN